MSSHGYPAGGSPVEGGQQLLDLKRAPALARTDLIVETHDRFNSGVTRRLIDRFYPTHRFEVIAGGEDADRPIPALVSEHIADPTEARSFVTDGRGMPELWLRLRARTP